MFSCLQILEALLWFVLITLLNVTLIILTLSVSSVLNLLLRLVALLLYLNSFFFSSRRRHTRFDCDWSSDVCSSDLGDFTVKLKNDRKRDIDDIMNDVRSEIEQTEPATKVEFVQVLQDMIGDLTSQPEQIGRASCRERV